VPVLYLKFCKNKDTRMNGGKAIPLPGPMPKPALPAHTETTRDAKSNDKEEDLHLLINKVMML